MKTTRPRGRWPRPASRGFQPARAGPPARRRPPRTRPSAAAIPMSFPGPEQFVEFVGELVDVAEVAVHRGEAHERHLVEVLELLHDLHADLVGGDLALRTLLQRGLDAVGNGLERRDPDGALLTRLEQAAHQFLSIEPLATSVLLHHHVRNFVDAL